MSLSDGMAALHLEMPGRVPRTEYSAHRHWGLVNRVTGRSAGPHSTPAEQDAASTAFMRAWNYDFFWNILTYTDALEKCRTKMGHAVFEDGGTDYDAEVVCPFAEPEDVLAFDPWEVYGAIDKRAAARAYEENYRQMQVLCPDAVNMTGIYITLVSGLVEIFGWEMLLMACGVDAAAFGEVANRYASWIGQYFEALAESNVPVVMVHDDIVWTEGAIFHPDWYRRYVFPNHKKLFAPLIESGKRILYTSDGTFTEFIDDIAGTGVHGFVMEPTTDMRQIAERYGRTHVFIGNADTRVLLTGSKEDIRAEVKRCMDIGKDCPGFFMAVGNHIPANTPVENALYYNECYEELSRR